MITIGFSKGNSLYSKAILAATQGVASHAFLAYNGTGNVNFGRIIQAGADGIQVTAEKPFYQTNDVVAECQITVPIAQEMDMISFANSQIGQRYDWAAVLGFGWVLGNSYLGRKVGNPLHEQGAYVCSVFCLSVLQKPNIPAWSELNGYDARTTTPEDLLVDLIGLASRCPNTMQWLSKPALESLRLP